MNNNRQKYITRDFYDANMAEFREAMRESMRAAEARCEKIAADIRAEAAQMRVEAAEMRAQYKITQNRLDNIEKSQDKFFRNAGFALAGMTLFFTAVQVIIALIK